MSESRTVYCECCRCRIPRKCELAHRRLLQNAHTNSSLEQGSRQQQIFDVSSDSESDLEETQVAQASIDNNLAGSSELDLHENEPWQGGADIESRTPSISSPKNTDDEATAFDHPNALDSSSDDDDDYGQEYTEFPRWEDYEDVFEDMGASDGYEAEAASIGMLNSVEIRC